VLVRLGLVREDKSYSRTYATGRQAADGLSADSRLMQEAHLVLQRHGQTLCKRNVPRCPKCPLAPGCAYGLVSKSALKLSANEGKRDAASRR